MLIVAIDGRSGAGKSSLADILREKLRASVVHMDDFFLQPHQRLPERYAEAGGNVDYERVEEEVLKPLKEGKQQLSYKRFDCSTMTMQEELVIDTSAPLVIVEGSYSCHPRLRKYYDLTVFLDVDKKTQLERLQERVGNARLEIFVEKWIPLEETYFAAYQIKESADVITKMDIIPAG